MYLICAISNQKNDMYQQAQEQKNPTDLSTPNSKKQDNSIKITKSRIDKKALEEYKPIGIGILIGLGLLFMYIFFNNKSTKESKEEKKSGIKTQKSKTLNISTEEEEEEDEDEYDASTDEEDEDEYDASTDEEGGKKTPKSDKEKRNHEEDKRKRTEKDKTKTDKEDVKKTPKSDEEKRKHTDKTKTDKEERKFKEDKHQEERKHTEKNKTKTDEEERKRQEEERNRAEEKKQQEEQKKEEEKRKFEKNMEELRTKEYQDIKDKYTELLMRGEYALPEMYNNSIISEALKVFEETDEGRVKFLEVICLQIWHTDLDKFVLLDDDTFDKIIDIGKVYMSKNARIISTTIYDEDGNKFNLKTLYTFILGHIYISADQCKTLLHLHIDQPFIISLNEIQKIIISLFSKNGWQGLEICQCLKEYIKRTDTTQTQDKIIQQTINRGKFEPVDASQYFTKHHILNFPYSMEITSYPLPIEAQIYIIIKYLHINGVRNCSKYNINLDLQYFLYSLLIGHNTLNDTLDAEIFKLINAISIKSNAIGNQDPDRYYFETRG